MCAKINLILSDFVAAELIWKYVILFQNWDEVENNVRRLAHYIRNDLIIYTGTAENLHLDSKKGTRKLALKRQPISTYLWKVRKRENQFFVVKKLLISN